ncbi:MAG: hypothetical protein ACK5Q5_08880 [Planctomycetaceae bacterium]
MTASSKPAHRRTSTAAISRPGVIERGAVYSLDEFLLRTGLSTAAYKQARRAGLRVRRAHKRAFIIGDDWLSYLESRDTPQ